MANVRIKLSRLATYKGYGLDVSQAEPYGDVDEATAHILCDRKRYFERVEEGKLPEFKEPPNEAPPKDKEPGDPDDDKDPNTDPSDEDPEDGKQNPEGDKNPEGAKETEPKEENTTQHPENADALSEVTPGEGKDTPKGTETNTGQNKGTTKQKTK